MLWARLQPDKTAFTFMERGEDASEALTYLELRNRAASIAQTLIAARLADKPVVLLYPPGLAFIEALLACFLAGVIAVPAPYPVTPRARRRIAGVASACEARAVLTLDRYVTSRELRGAIDGTDAIAEWIATDSVATAATWPADVGRDWSPDDVALLQFTSGSTAAPRGVVISFGNLAANHQMIAPSFGNDADEPSVTWLPMFHDMGLIGSVLYPLYACRTTHIMPPFAFLQKPVRWLRAITRLQATGSGAPSFAYDLCARMIKPEDREGLDLRRWTTAFCGAESVRAKSLSLFAETFAPYGFDAHAFLPCYGLAEATLFVSGGAKGSGLRVSKSRDTIVSCGVGLKPQTLAIVDEHGQRLPEGAEGEIWVAGPHVSRGYWRNPAATRDAFGATLADEPGFAYLRTGDLGFIEDGELFVSGRSKDVIVIRGANYHANDLDHTICDADPILLPGAGAVFALDEDGQQRIVAIQEVRKAAFAALDHAALFRTIARAVSVDHGIRLDRAVFVREGRLPRTTSGKIQRHLCLPLLTQADGESEANHAE